MILTSFHSVKNHVFQWILIIFVFPQPVFLVDNLKYEMLHDANLK